MTFSHSLMDHVREVKRTMVLDFSNRDIAIANLLFLYWACLASEQLLKDAADTMDLLPESPFNNRLSEYYRIHLEEERGEIALLISDLESVKVKPGGPDQIAMAMIGTQYYLIKHIHPSALLGYMAIQEADPTSIDAVNSLEKHYGKDMFRFIRLHAVKDLEHSKELVEVIDLAPEAMQNLIRGSADNAFTYMAMAAEQWGKPN